MPRDFAVVPEAIGSTRDSEAGAALLVVDQRNPAGDAAAQPAGKVCWDVPTLVGDAVWGITAL